MRSNVLYSLLTSITIVKYVAAAGPLVFPQSLSPSLLNQNASLGDFITRMGDSVDSTALIAFPAGAWLGHGIDMTGGLPTTVKDATSAVRTFVRLIDLDSQQQTTDIPRGSTWSYPVNVNVSLDVHDGSGSNHVFRTGSEAFDALKFGGKLAGKYKVVEGDASLDLSLRSTYKDSMQYFIFDFQYTMLQVEYVEWNKNIARDKLKDMLYRLPRFDEAKKDTIRAYREFFSLVGTHIVTGATYGARLSITMRADNSDKEVNANFASDVNVKLQGLPFDGEADRYINATHQYSKFESSVGKDCSGSGGDIAIADSLCANGNKNSKLYDSYKEWTETVDRWPEVSQFQTVPLSAIMRLSRDDHVESYAQDIDSAYEYLLSDPEVHETSVRLVITSDWASFTLLSPSAFVEPDPNYKFSGQGFFSNSSTNVEWHTGDGTVVNSLIIDFKVRSIGETFTMELSHGSNGATPGQGMITAYISNGLRPYVAQGIHDNNWNTEIFDVPIDPRGHILTESLSRSQITQKQHPLLRIAGLDAPDGEKPTSPATAKAKRSKLQALKSLFRVYSGED